MQTKMPHLMFFFSITSNTFLRFSFSTRKVTFKAGTLISKHLKLTSGNISKLALEVGFDACGVAPVRRLEKDAQFMTDWIAKGLHGQMDYLERNCNKRYDPTLLVPGAQSVVVCLLHFQHSGRDYHRRVKSMLYTLEAKLREQYGDDIVSHTHQHIFCDSAPMLERRWCVEAGLGFIGKNHQLIHPTLGSMVHPGEILLNLPIEQDNDPITTSTQSTTCGECHLCIDACPTGALRNPLWDATQCIAYTTHHCLACQLKCPYNT